MQWSRCSWGVGWFSLFSDASVWGLVVFTRGGTRMLGKVVISGVQVLIWGWCFFRGESDLFF